MIGKCLNPVSANMLVVVLLVEVLCPPLQDVLRGVISRLEHLGGEGSVHVLHQVLHALVLVVLLVVSGYHGDMVEAGHQDAVGDGPGVTTEIHPRGFPQELVNFLELHRELGLQFHLLGLVLVFGVLGKDPKELSSGFLCLLVPWKTEGGGRVGLLNVLHNLIRVSDDCISKLQSGHAPRWVDVRVPLWLVGEVNEYVGSFDSLQFEG